MSATNVFQFRHRGRAVSMTALVLCFVSLWGCGEKAVIASGHLAPVVNTVKAQTMSFTSEIGLSGTLVPERIVMVYSQTPGLVVTDLLVEEGQVIVEGQVLARLSSELQLAQLAGARGELKRAEKALSRVEALKASGAIAHSEIDTARATYAEALASARTLEIDLARTDLKAPVAGFLQRRNIEMGEAVNNQPLFEIAAGQRIELLVDVSETAWPQIEPGQHAQVYLSGQPVVDGQVRRISGALDPKTRLGKAWISLNEPAVSLTSGSGATARIMVGNAVRLVVPQSALLFDVNGTYVFVVANNTAEQRRIRLGEQNSQYAEVLEGLVAGDEVVSRAGSLLRHGDPVQIAHKSERGNP